MVFRVCFSEILSKTAAVRSIECSRVVSWLVNFSIQKWKSCLLKVAYGSGGIRTHASEEKHQEELRSLLIPSTLCSELHREQQFPPEPMEILLCARNGWNSAPPASREAIPVPDTPATDYGKADTSCKSSDVSFQDLILQTLTPEKLRERKPPHRFYSFTILLVH